MRNGKGSWAFIYEYLWKQPLHRSVALMTNNFQVLLQGSKQRNTRKWEFAIKMVMENSLAQTQLFSAKSEALLCWVDEFLQEVKLQAYLERAVTIGIPVDDLADPDQGLLNSWRNPSGDNKSGIWCLNDLHFHWFSMESLGIIKLFKGDFYFTAWAKMNALCNILKFIFLKCHILVLEKGLLFQNLTHVMQFVVKHDSFLNRKFTVRCTWEENFVSLDARTPDKHQ